MALPEPRYDREGVMLYHGDCREVMRGLDLSEVAAIVTDPPYGINARTDYKSKGRTKLAECNDFPPIEGDDQPFDPSLWLGFPKVVLFGANYYASRLPDASCWFVWDKRDGMNPNDNADCELAWTNLGGPARVCHHRWNGMIKDSERTERRVHPTQKPTRLMRWCIEQLKLDPGDTILDPYMGSGSTAVAAVRLGFKFIGIEISDAYVEIACRRLRAAETPLFADMTG